MIEPYNNRETIYQVKEYCECCGKDLDVETTDIKDSDSYDVSKVFKYLSDLLDISPLALDALIAQVNHRDASISELSKICKRDDRALSNSLKTIILIKPELSKMLKGFDMRVIKQANRRQKEQDQMEIMRLKSWLIGYDYN